MPPGTQWRLRWIKGTGQKVSVLVGRINNVGNVISLDPAEAPREAFVVGNDVLPKGKDIHGAILSCPWAAVVGEYQQGR